VLSPAWGVSSEDHLRRALSPLAIRAGSIVGAHTLRLEVHPADLDHPRHMLALEWVLRRAGQRREAITYDDLLADADGSAGERERTPPAGVSAAGARIHPLHAPSRQA
jgi:hypothetical protein